MHHFIFMLMLAEQFFLILFLSFLLNRGRIGGFCVAFCC